MHHKNALLFSFKEQSLSEHGACNERSMLYIANEILLTLDMATASVTKSLLRSVHRPALFGELVGKAMH